MSASTAHNALTSLALSSTPLPVSETPENANLTLLPEDLHTHSTASDGALSPLELMAAAAAVGLQRLAITDHDCVDGCRAIQELDSPDSHWPELVPGVELSTLWCGIDVHVVGLGIDIDNERLLDHVAQQRRNRWHRIELIATRLRRSDLRVDVDRVRELAGDGVPGRPHVARQLTESGQVASEAKAFERWLGRGKIGDVKQLWPEIQVSVAAIREAGGVAVLAHPLKYRLTASKLRRLVAEFVEAGGRGIEILSGAHAGGGIETVVRLAGEYDLRASWGSDFHAPGPWSSLGVTGPLPAQCRPVTELL